MFVVADSDVGAADRNDSRNALHPLDDHLAFLVKLGAAQFIELHDVIALVSRVDGAGINGLPVDDRGADDEPDRNCELQHDEGSAQPSRAGRFGRGPVCLEHLRRLEAREEEGRIQAARHADDQGERDRRKQDAAAAKIIYREIGVQKCCEGPDQQLDQRHRNKHRSP